jgi:hypothetical protein
MNRQLGIDVLDGAPRLAAAFGTDRSRWDSAAELQAHSGIAPVTERSGKSLWVHHRASNVSMAARSVRSWVA